jgi:hypothetical protein
MRSLLVLAVAVAVAVAACVPPDTAHTEISLPAPYDSWPVPAGAPIESGTPVKLDPRQQEVIVIGATQWMKDKGSVHFGSMEAVRNTSGAITVCGNVNGRNSAGIYAGMAPFIGVLLGTAKEPEFVIVGIGSTDRDRAQVISLCRQSGIK